MKRSLALFFLSSVFSFQLLAQQVANGSFETWINGEPDPWTTSNQNVLGLVNFTMVTKDVTDPMDGTASAKLAVVTKTIPFVGTYTLPGILTLGKLNIDLVAQTASLSGGAAFTGRPLKLTGYYKYQPVNNDVCVIGCGLSRWNNGITDTIGFGAMNTNATLNAWTYFEIPLTYHLPDAPDTVNILILNSNPVDGLNHTGTTMWIDNLAFDYGTVGIEGISFPGNLKIYAEPYTRQLIFSATFDKQENLDISLYSMSGLEIRHWKRTLQKSTERLDLENLTPGIYVVRISSGNRLLDSRKITILN